MTILQKSSSKENFDKEVYPDFKEPINDVLHRQKAAHFVHLIDTN